MKIVYAGSPEYAVKPLDALIEAGAEVIAVVTQPDKPTGRKRVLTPTPVKSRALSLGIPVYDFVKVREHAEELKALNADLMITCAYGQLLTEDVLRSFPRGCTICTPRCCPNFAAQAPFSRQYLRARSSRE